MKQQRIRACFLVVVLLSVSIGTVSKTKIQPPNDQAPESFAVELDSTKGKLVIEVYRSWAPNSADRFYNMVNSGYLNGSIFHHVILGSAVAFGLNADPKKSKIWLDTPMPSDTPRRKTRAGDVYLVPVPYRDFDLTTFVGIQTGIEGSDASRDGATPLGRVVEGVEILDQLDNTHMAKGNWVSRRLAGKGEGKVRKKFPQIDSVTRAILLDYTPDLPPVSEIDNQFVMSEEMPPGQALLRIYRKDKVNQNFNIRIDGAMVARLKPGTVYETYLPAGQHEISGKVAFKMFATGLLDKAFAGGSKLADHFDDGAVYHIRAVAGGVNGRTLLWVRVANDYGSEDSVNLTPAQDLTRDKSTATQVGNH